MSADRPRPAAPNSGAAWLGDVPEGWRVLPARSLFEEIVERDQPEAQLLSVTIGDGVVPQADLLEARSSKDGSNLDKSSYKVVRPGDLVYNKMRAWQGAAGCSPAHGIVSPAYVVVRSRGTIDPAFAHWLLRTPAFAKEAERWSYGITSDQWSLRPKDFKQIYLPLPPAETQAAIVGYLGETGARIGRLLAAKERLIALLDEEEGAAILDAVTAGLDPRAPRRDSGVDWLGEIPAHWEVRELRRLGRIQGGMTPSMDQASFWDGPFPWVSPKDMKRPVIDSSIDSVTDSAVAETGLRLVPSGSVLMVVRGMILARRVPIALTSTEVTMNQDMKAIVPGRDLDGAYLANVLRAAQGPLMAMIDESGHGTRRLPTELWRRLPLPLPPRDEQSRIVAHIEERVAVVNEARVRAARHIELLREYQLRLASDVVTGKLDPAFAAVP